MATCSLGHLIPPPPFLQALQDMAHGLSRATSPSQSHPSLDVNHQCQPTPTHNGKDEAAVQQAQSVGAEPRVVAARGQGKEGAGQGKSVGNGQGSTGGKGVGSRGPAGTGGWRCTTRRCHRWIEGQGAWAECGIQLGCGRQVGGTLGDWR